MNTGLLQIGLIAAALGALAADGAAASSSDADEAVAAGREALSGRPAFPWYDAANDDVRAVKVREPWEWPDWSLGNWNVPGRPFVWLMWTVLALLLGLLLYVIVRAWIARERFERQRMRKAAGTAGASASINYEALPVELDPSSLDPLARARHHYERGEYREAIIYLFSHELIELDRRHLIRLAKGKTNRQYLRELAGQSPLVSLVGQTMTAFEDVFFGDHPIDARRFEACWQRLSEFEALTARGSS